MATNGQKPVLYTIKDICSILKIAYPMFTTLKARSGVEPTEIGTGHVYSEGQLQILRQEYDRYLPNRDKEKFRKPGRPRVSERATG